MVRGNCTVRETGLTGLCLCVAGELALAKYSDGKWYRAGITRVLGHQLEVELIDFGTIICVSSIDGYVTVFVAVIAVR